jgi:hypothetical protein
MKYMLLLCTILSLQSFAQTSTKSGIKNDTPAELLTDDTTYWSITTLSSVNYVNTTPGAYYNTYKSGGGMIVKFKFKKGGRFEFSLYVQANSYGTDTEAWTNVEGTVTFTKDAKGQQIFITKAEKGIYRTVKNGIASSRAIPESDLKGQHSCTYLWEKTKLKDDPNHIYLLMVDLEQHPQADVNNPKTIDPSWVSKFHIPAK